MPPLIEQDALRKDHKAHPRHIFLLYEGLNTEVSLISPLISNEYALKNSSSLFIPLTKTGATVGATNPFTLIKEANNFISTKSSRGLFTPGYDKVMIVFDLDVLMNSQYSCNLLLQQKTKDMILCYTNPAIELFILLTKSNSFETIIKPHEKEILANKYIPGTKERFLYHLLKESMQLDSKDKSTDFRPVIANSDIAFAQENIYLNHHLSKAANRLTSNIGYVLKKIEQDEIDQITY